MSLVDGQTCWNWVGNFEYHGPPELEGFSRFEWAHKICQNILFFMDCLLGVVPMPPIHACITNVGWVSTWVYKFMPYDAKILKILK